MKAYWFMKCTLITREIFVLILEKYRRYNLSYQICINMLISKLKHSYVSVSNWKIVFTETCHQWMPKATQPWHKKYPESQNFTNSNPSMMKLWKKMESWNAVGEFIKIVISRIFFKLYILKIYTCTTSKGNDTWSE